MKQGLQFPLFGGMLLLIGVAAGTMIPAEVRWLNPPTVLPHPEVVAAPEFVAQVQDAAQADEIALPMSSQASVLFSSQSTTAEDEGSSPFQLAAITAPGDHEVACRLIRQAFPDADATTVNVWAETFQGLSPVEIHDILEQKKLLSGSLDSSFFPGLGSREPIGMAVRSPDIREQERQICRQNLRHAWAVGYRRRLMLPGVPGNCHPEPTGAAAVTATGQDFIDFSSGRQVRSPQPLHVAFAASPLHMFLLEDGRLTRRGDFSILPTLQPGLMTASGPGPLRGAPRIEDRERRLRVSETGELQAAVEGDSWSVIGRLTAVEVLRPELLTTDDGVHFQATAPEAWRELLPEEIRLLPGTLELSNVNSAEELQRLDALDR
ncbi:MAG: hypothetical protein ACKO2P_11455 [Planctomycetota bacterium]